MLIYQYFEESPLAQDECVGARRASPLRLFGLPASINNPKISDHLNLKFSPPHL